MYLSMVSMTILSDHHQNHNNQHLQHGSLEVGDPLILHLHYHYHFYHYHYHCYQVDPSDGGEYMCLLNQEDVFHTDRR